MISEDDIGKCDENIIRTLGIKHSLFDLSVDYSWCLLLASERNIDFASINQRIISQHGTEGLKSVKKVAWKIVIQDKNGGVK